MEPRAVALPTVVPTPNESAAGVADVAMVPAGIDLPTSMAIPPTSARGAGPQNSIPLLVRCTAGATLCWLVWCLGCCNNLLPPRATKRVSTLEQEKTSLRARARVALLVRHSAGATLCWFVYWLGCGVDLFSLPHSCYPIAAKKVPTLEQEKTSLRARARVALLARCSAGAIICWSVYWFGCCVNLCSLHHSCYPICCLLRSAPSLPTLTSRHLPPPPSYSQLY